MVYRLGKDLLVRWQIMSSCIAQISGSQRLGTTTVDVSRTIHPGIFIIVDLECHW